MNFEGWIGQGLHRYERDGKSGPSRLVGEKLEDSWKGGEMNLQGGVGQDLHDYQREGKSEPSRLIDDDFEEWGRDRKGGP